MRFFVVAAAVAGAAAFSATPGSNWPPAAYSAAANTLKQMSGAQKLSMLHGAFALFSIEITPDLQRSERVKPLRIYMSRAWRDGAFGGLSS